MDLAVECWRHMVYNMGQQELFCEYLEAKIAMVQLLSLSGDNRVASASADVDRELSRAQFSGSSLQLQALARSWQGMRAVFLGHE